MPQLRLRLLSLLCLCCIVGSSWGKIAHLLPRPHAVVRTKGHFSLARPVLLDDPTHCAQLAAVFAAMRCSFSEKAQAAVRVRLDSTLDTFDYPLEGFPSEGYRLRISPQSIDITAATPVGVIRAAQTLRQLAQGSATPQLECLTITDFPAFKVRGFMHDVGRSFIPIDDLRRQIDLLSRFKVNVFHWHLTENQAWRLKIKAFPQLTSAASMTRFAGQYYTQAEARTLEAYARERGVTIIPEIDMPGHSEAFVRAMGFDMQSAQGVAALHTILEEVAAIFPHAPYLHIGADEKRITYPDFLPQIIAKVHALGRKVVVWNPIQGVDLSTLDIDMTQMWSTTGRKIAGKPNIDCRYNYTNHFDVFADLVGIYKSNIYYAPRERRVGRYDVVLMERPPTLQRLGHSAAEQFLRQRPRFGRTRLDRRRRSLHRARRRRASQRRCGVRSVSRLGTPFSLPQVHHPRRRTGALRPTDQRRVAHHRCLPQRR